MKLSRVPKWFHDTGTIPPFATEAEGSEAYATYVNAVTEKQFSGIRLGSGDGEVVVLWEVPGQEPIPAGGLMNGLDDDYAAPMFEWTPNHGGTVYLARTMLHACDGEGAADLYAREFADKIVSKLARHQWTLTQASIVAWVEAMDRATGRRDVGR